MQRARFSALYLAARGASAVVSSSFLLSPPCRQLNYFVGSSGLIKSEAALKIKYMWLAVCQFEKIGLRVRSRPLFVASMCNIA